MSICALDIGSSSVKAAVLRGTRIHGAPARVEFATSRRGDRAEVDPADLLRAISRAIHQLEPAARRAEALALSVMSPAWVAMDRRGRAITPIVTHEDRRSVEEARLIEQCVGRRRHLRLAGNRPFPGGISSTTFAWFARHHSDVMRRCDLAGHLNTFLHRRWTGQRVIDPSNASFSGFFKTLTQGGWSDELLDGAGATISQMPEIVASDGIAGRLTRFAASELGLPQGMPVLAGIVDGGSGMLLAGATPGQLYHVSGSTDVLALCTDRPAPHERLLLRALGVDRKWVAVGTIAAAGSAVEWMRRQFFADRGWPAFARLIARLARDTDPSSVTCAPWLAGDRMSIEQPTASFNGLTLASTREDLLKALIDALVAASAERVALLRNQPVKIKPEVVVSAGPSVLASVIRRGWPRQWHYRAIGSATLMGLGRLRPRES